MKTFREKVHYYVLGNFTSICLTYMNLNMLLKLDDRLICNFSYESIGFSSDSSVCLNVV